MIHFREGRCTPPQTDQEPENSPIEDHIPSGFGVPSSFAGVCFGAPPSIKGGPPDAVRVLSHESLQHAIDREADRGETGGSKGPGPTRGSFG